MKTKQKILILQRTQSDGFYTLTFEIQKRKLVMASHDGSYFQKVKDDGPKKKGEENAVGGL